MEFVNKIIIDHFRWIMLENSNIKFHSLFYDKISKNCHRAANQYVYDSISVIFEPIRIKMVQFLLFSNRSLNVINIEESVLMRVVTLTMIVFDKSVIQCVLMSPHNNSGLVQKCHKDLSSAVLPTHVVEMSLPCVAQSSCKHLHSNHRLVLLPRKKRNNPTIRVMLKMLDLVACLQHAIFHRSLSPLSTDHYLCNLYVTLFFALGCVPSNPIISGLLTQ